MNRVTLAMLEITDGDLPPAILNFTKGLNVLSGVENRGKTFAFKCLDFLMGAKKAPKPNSHSTGYTTATVYFTINDDRRGGVRREFQSGKAEYLPYHALNQDVSAARWSGLAKTHSAKKESISTFWVSAFGFTPTKLRGNMSGDIKAFTVRYLAHLVLIDEMRIMAETTTARTSQATGWPAEGDAFSLMIGARKNPPGVIDSKPLNTGMQSGVREFISQEIDQLKVQLAAIPFVGSYDDEAAQITRRTREFTEAANNAAMKLQEAFFRIGEIQRNLTEAKATTKTSREIAVRLELLQEYYQADLRRLGAVSETAFLLEQLNEVKCPTCLRPFAAPGEKASDVISKEYLSQIVLGSRVEAEKIRRLGSDLALTLARAREEFEDARLSELEWMESLKSFQDTAKTQNEQVAAAHTQLSKTFAAMGPLAERKVLQQRSSFLTQQLDDGTVLDAAPAEERTDFDRASVNGFCETVRKLLEKWKWNYTRPPLSVTFDQANTDILISGQTRDSFGKAVRALISSAFVIGLMDYCHENDLPHPGFVVLDSPLTTKKESTAASSTNDNVSDDILTAFFTHLARNYADKQVIIIDNKEPPAFLEKEINHIRFGDDPKATRQGLFPANT
jgi:hypothetical protein